MDVRELIAFLHRVKCWIPHSNITIRSEIEAVIEKLKMGM